ncbi:MAG: 16S rRNA (guanine(527)-N(7))-methyltransferase RsmG [Limnochordia bacterium]
MQTAFMESLVQASEAMSIHLSARQLEQCARFARLLITRNEEMNLTSLVEPEEIAVKHFVDSFTCLDVGFWPESCRAVDVGTGAGFPGIPLAIMRPDISWILIEALRKRVDFVNEAVAELGLTQVRCVHVRAEDFGRDAAARESFDIAVARAVSRLPVLLEYCVPLVKVGGGVITMKGPEVEEEMAEACVAAKTLGVDQAAVKKLELPGGSGGRTLIWYHKLHATPSAYPRRAGIVHKRPLG